jgi:hypothetical protein
VRELTQKLRNVEAQIDREKGPLNLFALFEREDLSSRWDLVVAASWAKHDEPTLRYIAEVLKEHLRPEEMVLLARMVILDAHEEPVKALTSTFDVQHGHEEASNLARFGLPVDHGFIITSRRAA